MKKALHNPEMEANEMIPRGHFSNCQHLVTVILPPSVTSIRTEAFKNCTVLRDINLEHVIYINESAFYNSGLYKIKLLSVTHLLSQAFRKCFNLSDVIFHNSKFVHISPRVFMDCKALQNINLPERLPYISSGLFMNCKSLKTIHIPQSIRQIVFNSFKNCSLLQSIDLQNVANIGEKSFENCASLTSLNIGMSRNWSEISEYSFANCFALENIMLCNPKLIADYAFKNCVNLTEVTIKGILIDDRVQSKSFHNCTRLINWNGDSNPQLSIMILLNQQECFRNIKHFMCCYGYCFDELMVGEIISNFLINMT